MASPNGQSPARSTRSSLTAAGRLPSLRPIRDLSLGGGTTSVSTPLPAPASATPNPTPPAPQPSTRPKFTPNLANAGKRQAPAPTPNAKPSTGPSTASDNRRGRGARGGQQGDRGARGGRGAARGRGGRHEPEIIQSKGIFSEGFAESDLSKSRERIDFDGGGSISRKRERLNESKESLTKAGAKSEAIETDEQALKNLYKDDFIVYRPSPDRVKPVTLPLNPSSARRMGQQKSEDAATAMDIDLEKKPDVSALNERKPNIVLRDPNISFGRNALPPAFQELFGLNDTKSGQGTLFFIQLPNIMADLLAPSTPAQEQPAAAVDPLVKAELMDVDESAQVPQQNGVPLRPDPEVETVISPGDTTTSNQSVPKSKHTLADLPQGQVGKLQLLKSGRVRLKLNGTSPDKPLIFDAAPGTSTAFLQQVVSIRAPSQPEGAASEEEGRLCVLGDVGHRVLFTPKIDNVLANLKRLSR